MIDFPCRTALIGGAGADRSAWSFEVVAALGSGFEMAPRLVRGALLRG